MRFVISFVVGVLVILGSHSAVAPAAQESTRAALAETTHLSRLGPQLMRLANATPGVVAVSVIDLDSGASFAINGDENLPAASTIKVPVMVEVLRQINIGKFSFQRTVSLTDADRDCGYGSLCTAHWGSQYTVLQLVWTMITASDNTATNMLIRLVGRQHINQTMSGLGLDQTWLGDAIRSDGDIRVLRTSANDMMQLLGMIAGHRLINAQACDEMLQILSGQRHNQLLPAWLPKGLTIAHKTGTLRDTLNDVGIVELDGAPYIICVMTTHLADLDDGERFIRRASLLTYRAFFRKNMSAVVNN